MHTNTPIKSIKNAIIIELQCKISAAEVELYELAIHEFMNQYYNHVTDSWTKNALSWRINNRVQVLNEDKNRLARVKKELASLI